MSDNTTRIVDLPENISIQMPPSAGIMNMTGSPSFSIPSTNTRTEYDPQNPTYTPMNIHPNPYGNSIQPNVLPLPQPKYQAPSQQGGQDLDPIAELRQMEPVRLPSRDIPMDQLQYQQDIEIQPNYIPKPKLTKDYVREYEEAAEKSAKKHEKTKKHEQNLTRRRSQTEPTHQVVEEVVVPIVEEVVVEKVVIEEIVSPIVEEIVEEKVVIEEYKSPRKQ